MSFSPKQKPGLSPMQTRYLIIAWVAASIIVGFCTFGAIFAAGGGMDVFTTPTAKAVAGNGSAAPKSVTQLPSTAAPAASKAPAQTQPVASQPTQGGLAPVGNFALGGQAIHGGFPGMAAMKKAGMTWVKLQASDLKTDFGPAIDNAHKNNMRILVSVVDKTEERYKVATPEYQQKFASYLVTLAKQGADAIEVWNEMNLEREWPKGQISGESYTKLLKFVYPQIKIANPNTIVIIGAPSPTGFFGGGCDANRQQGCDDKPFLEEMVRAGAFDFADCTGIHYNEGILPPSATSGDPRGNSTHYTRYYSSMVDTYWKATSAKKPLCFTELGYLTGEGYPDLTKTAPTFSWASKTTVAQQAQWLAEAVTLARDSGKVKLLIVFNVDFVTYDSDPQAGYAIIRKDGLCPACDTLGKVMGVK
ncbi:MAG: hypothetical protein AAB571_06055 [Chloroflexota bacterium]